MRPRMRTVRSRSAGRVHPQGYREFCSVSAREEWPWAKGKFSLNPEREAPGFAPTREQIERLTEERSWLTHVSVSSTNIDRTLLAFVDSGARRLTMELGAES